MSEWQIHQVAFNFVSRLFADFLLCNKKFRHNFSIFSFEQILNGRLMLFFLFFFWSGISRFICLILSQFCFQLTCWVELIIEHNNNKKSTFNFLIDFNSLLKKNPNRKLPKWIIWKSKSKQNSTRDKIEIII